MSSSTLAVLGCGQLGIAVLAGILASFEGSTESSTSSEAQNERHPAMPSKFIACTRSFSSASRVERALAGHQSKVSIYHGDQAVPLDTADIVVLGCRPKDLYACLERPGIRSQLRGKLIISLLAGVTIQQIEDKLHDDLDLSPPTIVRVLPNIGSQVRESMTLIEARPSTPSSVLSLLEALFGTLGPVRHVYAAHFDTCTALAGCTPAFFALMLEALIDGAVATGVSRADATAIAAQTMRGSSGLVLDGQSPEEVRLGIATEGSATIQGVRILDEQDVRGTMTKAFLKCKEAMENL